MISRSERAWREFRDAIEATGGTVLESDWLGSVTPHRIRCIAGHDGTIRPNNVKNGQGSCRTCGGRDSENAWRAFRDTVASQGGTVLEDRWKGKDVPHAVRCASGHVGRPTPGSIQHGNGICHKCAHKIWDAFYVVRNRNAGTIKFGITSGDPRSRLNGHARDGFTEVVRIFKGLPDGTAKSLEDELRLLLKCANVAPIRGREYFSDAVAPMVLSVVDAWGIE